MLLAKAALIAFLFAPSLADFIIENGRIAVLDVNGITSKTLEFSTKTPSASPTNLDIDGENTLKVTFDILETSGQLISPHQLTLLATGIDTKLHWATAIKARGKGKAKWELNLARAPIDFLSLSPSGQVTLELILGDISSTHAALRFKLANLQIPKSLTLRYPYWDTKDGKPPSALGLEKYYAQPKLDWTFQPPRKKENPVLSLAFVAVVFSPWALLILAWTQLSRSTIGGFKLLQVPKTSTLLFILTLLSQEALILTYWAKLKIYQYLPLAFLISMPLILTGRASLGELRARRKAHPISAGRVNASILIGEKDKSKNE